MVQVELVEGHLSPTEGDCSLEVSDVLQGEGLTDQQQACLQVLLRKCEKVFATSEEDYGRTSTIQHQIRTGNAAAIKERYCPLPPMMYKEMRNKRRHYWQVCWRAE